VCGLQIALIYLVNIRTRKRPDVTQPKTGVSPAHTVVWQVTREYISQQLPVWQEKPDERIL